MSKTTPRTTTKTISVPMDVCANIETIAIQERRSFSAQVSVILEEYARNFDASMAADGK